MRSAALIAALACATMAHADGVRESRYGPERERAPTPMNGSPAYGAQPYAGRTLGWTGKREAVAATAPQTAAQVQPWWSRSAVAPAPARAPVPQQAARAPIPQVQQTPARALPQNLYDTPQPVQPQPQAYAQAPAPAPRALLPGQTTARTYSVGRQFGQQPDPIPAAGPSRMVLVGPPATAPDEEPGPRDDRDWPAADRPNSDRKDDTQ